MAMKTAKHRYMLIDGHALVHRGFHAVPGLTTKTGEPVGAVYGFTMILLRAIKELKPTHIACAFDLDGPTFRHDQYADYKGTRAAVADDLVVQFPRVKEVVRALNIPIFEKDGFEADDVLGTLAVEICKLYPSSSPSGRGQGEGVDVMIATGDLDSLQLVNDCVKIYTLRKGITDTAVYDEAAIKERYGLTPKQMIDYKALRGDPSDNIKGVKGIGEKTAAELIQRFGSINKLYHQLKSSAQGGPASGGNSSLTPPLKPRVLQLLIDGEEAARQSYHLSTIVTNVPLDITIPAYSFGADELARTVELFKQLEFKSLVDKLPKGYTAEPQLKVESEKLKVDTASALPVEVEGPSDNGVDIGKQDYQLVDTDAKLDKLITKLKKQESFALDTESTSLNIIDAELVGISVSYKPGEAYYIPAQLVTGSKEFIKVLESDALKTGHNIKFDYLILKNAGIELGGVSFDTMIASYLLNAGTRQHSLDTLAFNELGYTMQPIEALIGKGKTAITMDQVPVEKVSWYAAEDVDITLRLQERFAPQLQKEQLDALFKDIEMPLVCVLAAMERQGIKVDAKLLKSLSEQAEKEIYALEKNIHSLAGREFNINSPKQLKEILFDELQLSSEGNRKTKTGLSTAAGELEKMLGTHPIIEKILQYRELAKLQSTYLLALPELINKKTGRIHTNYNQTIAATGRLSSTDPNLQNIPVRDSGLGSEIRKAFVAEKGYKLVSVDYSQMELRIVAHLSQDENMMRVFREGEDIHMNTAMELFAVPAGRVTKEMRRHAKTVNFGILYGLSAFGLSYRIHELAHLDAKEYIEKYFAAYPGVKKYVDAIKKEVNAKGEIRNQLGRVRKFPEIKSSQFFIRQAAERAAVNFPIQSLQADVLKVAMINIWSKIKDKGLEIRMLLQVHDELVFEVREDKVQEYIDLIQPLMEGAIELSVPVESEAKVGDNWGELEKV